MSDYYNNHKKDLDKWHAYYSSSQEEHLQFRAKMIESLIPVEFRK